MTGRGDVPATLGPDQRKRLQRIESLSRILDTSIGIPGTRFRFGLDALVGLIPGIGDAAGAAMSGWLILQAAQLGAPKSVLLRMVGNVGVETLVGAVPLVGDLFDAVYKANVRNVALLERHLGAPAATRRSSRGVVAGAIGLLVLIVVIGIAAAVWLGREIAARF